MKLSSFLHFATFGVKTILFRQKSPILGTVIVTDKCNLHCKHCSVNNITAVVHPYEQIRQEMQQLYDMGVRILFFCGGETFLMLGFVKEHCGTYEMTLKGAFYYHYYENYYTLSYIDKMWGIMRKEAFPEHIEL